MRKKEGIYLDNLSIGYDKKRPLIKGLSLFMDEKEFWAVVGPNGTGKSTLIKTILGIIPPIEGKIYIHGIDCTYPKNCEEKHFLSYVPQKENYSKMFPSTTLDIVISGLFPTKKRFEFIKTEEIKEAKKWIKFLELEDVINKRFSDLSGGQQKKTLMARAVIGNPHYIFLDEPTTGVDIKSSRKILKILEELHKKNFGICMITHDINFIWSLIDKVILLGKNNFFIGKREEILNEKILSEIYEVSVKIVETETGPLFITGDKH